MPEEPFLFSLGLMIGAAALFALGARLIKMPTIVAYLLAGLALGPLTGLVEISPALDLISELGIALLLFLVGLELSLNRIRDVGKVAILAGLGQVVFTALGGLVICWLLGFSWVEAIFLATALTFSSTVVVVKLLDEKNELNTLYGRIAVGIFLVQDLVVIGVLTFLSGLDTAEGANLAGIGFGLAKAFLGMGALLVFVMLSSRFLLPRPFAWAARSPETLFIWSLCWLFFIVTAAHFLALSLEIGAFLAGLSLAQLPYNHDLRRRVHPLMNFFIAVFFVALGVQMELGAAAAQWPSALALSLFVLLGNPFIFMWIIARMGYSERTSFLTSITVAQISEFSFIFVAMGVGAGLIQPEILSLTAVVGVLTIALSSYMILYNHAFYAWIQKTALLKPFGAGTAPDPEFGGEPEPENHIIVVGLNALGLDLVRRLTAAGEQVLAIDTDPRKLARLPCRTLLGNVEYLSTLEEAGLARAKLLISALHIEDTNDLLAYRCRKLKIPCSIQVIDLSVIDNLLDLDVSYLIIPKVDGIKLQNKELKTMGFLSK